eukprot:11716702-Alexandrium_andersonii.AAC.1
MSLLEATRARHGRVSVPDIAAQPLNKARGRAARARCFETENAEYCKRGRLRPERSRQAPWVQEASRQAE